MFKKSVILAVVGVALFLSQGANAIPWGKIDAVPDSPAMYVQRYEVQQMQVSVKYTPYLFGYLPVYVEVSIEGSPEWLVVTASPQTMVLSPGKQEYVTLALGVRKHDITAGDRGEVIVAVRGRLVTGGIFRQIDEAKFSIQVAYNPFTEIAVSAVQPIERTAPDRELPFILHIYNYGNSPVVVDLTAEKEPGEGWKYIINPSTVKIEPKQPGDETYPYATVTVTLTSPHGTVISYHNDWTQFIIKAKAKSEAPYWEYQGGKWVRRTDDIDLVTSYETYVYCMAKNKGFYVPGFDAIFLIAGLAIVGLLMAKKKK